MKIVEIKNIRNGLRYFFLISLFLPLLLNEEVKKVPKAGCDEMAKNVTYILLVFAVFVVFGLIAVAIMSVIEYFSAHQYNYHSREKVQFPQVTYLLLWYNIVTTGMVFILYMFSLALFIYEKFYITVAAIPFVLIIWILANALGLKGKRL